MLDAGIGDVRRVGGPPEQSLLLEAALLAAVRAAGVAVARVDVPLPDLSDDEGPVCSVGATQMLDLLLSGTVAVAGERDNLIQLWATCCSDASQRVSHRQLPDLLARATNVAALRNAVSRAGGPRARLLARANADWSWVLSRRELDKDQECSIDPDELAHADSNIIGALARAWRATDAAAARDALQQTWLSRSAPDRVEMVNALTHALSDDDETFLESALDDRSKLVRAAAASLLALLPTSQFAARMRERLSPIIVKKRAIVSSKPSIELPDTELFDSSWTRDGLDMKAPTGVGERAWLLRSLGTVAPLAAWETASGLSAEQLIEAARTGAAVSGLIPAWAHAAVAQQNAAWARALYSTNGSTNVLGVLPRHEVEAIALALLRDKNAKAERLYAALLTLGPPTHAVALALAQRLGKNGSDPLAARTDIVAAALTMLSAEEAEPLMRLYPDDDHHQRALRHAQAAHSRRTAIIKEFT